MVDQYFVQVASFLDFARLVCALRENPLRVYSFKYKGEKIYSTRTVLPNSILHFYVEYVKDGIYISYNPQSGKEVADVVNSTKTISNYAPIIEIESLPFPIKSSKRIKDKFKTIRVHELGDLARLTYDPEFPEEVDPTLYTFMHKKKWVIGYITEIELDDKVFCFNYLNLDKEPKFPFVKYSGHRGKPPEFTNKFQHGYPYLPVIKIKSDHPIFGLK